MITEILIIIALNMTTQISVCQDVFYYEDLQLCLDNIDLCFENIINAEINNKCQYNHVDIRCRIINRSLFNLDMFRKSLHPV